MNRFILGVKKEIKGYGSSIHELCTDEPLLSIPLSFAVLILPIILWLPWYSFFYLFGFRYIDLSLNWILNFLKPKESHRKIHLYIFLIFAAAFVICLNFVPGRSYMEAVMYWMLLYSGVTFARLS